MAKKQSKKIKAIKFTILLLIIFLAVIGYLIWTGGRILPKFEKTVALVNGEKIFQSELDSEYSRLPVQYQLILSKEELLNQLIDRKLLLQEARKAGIKADKSEVDGEINSLKSQFPSEEEFRKAVASQNFTIEMIRKMVTEQILLNKLLNQSVYAAVNVTAEEVSAYYAKNKDALFTAKEGQIRASHILVETEKKARDLKSLLDNGADFGQLAFEESRDTSAKSNNGYLGFFSKGAMVKEFEDAAFSLTVGQISEPVQTNFGFHIIKRLADVVSFEEARESIYLTILKQKQSDEIEQFVLQLRNKSVIKIIGEEKPVQETQEMGANEFKETSDEVCKEGGKPVIRRYIAAECEACRNVEPAFKAALFGYDVALKEIELDKAVKEGLPKSELDILKKYNPKGAVPAYIFGCKYYRIGNAYESLNLTQEEKIFKETLLKVVS
jgi:foldase protein PrsA